MSRPRNPIGTYGVIHTQEVTQGKWRARTRFRFEDGRLRQVERFGPSENKAELALRRALLTITASSSAEVKRETKLRELADRFLESKSSRAPRTIDTYRQTIDHLVKPKIGSLTVAEASTERLGRFITQITVDNGPGAAKACRAVLSGMMGIAARTDAIRVNPVREIAHISRPGRGATAIPTTELPSLLTAVRDDERLQTLDQSDLIAFLAGTGCRLGEALAITWTALDLEAGTVRIEANVIRAKGQGVVIQSHPKTKAGVRTIALPQALMVMLHERRSRNSANIHNLVFPTVLGNIRDPRNTSRDWREARDRLGYPKVTTHSFRKTVATVLDQAGLSAREIAEYLGHENPSLTQDVYMAKNTGGKKAALALDHLVASN